MNYKSENMAEYRWYNMIYISWILSITATILGIIEPFNKKMTGVLIFNLIGNFIVGINYPLSGSLSISGMAICLVACVQVFINFFFFTRKEIEVPKWIIPVYLIVFYAVNLLSFTQWYDLLVFGTSTCYVLSISQKSTRMYRILYCINSALWILYDFLAHSYSNLATHIALVVFTLVSMVINDRKEKHGGE